MNTNEYGMILPPARKRRGRVLKALSLIVAGVAVVIVVVAVVAGCSGSSGHGQTVTSHDPTVQQIAAANGLTRAKDCGNSNPLFTTSTGVAYRGSVKYGIDTFASSTARDAWLEVAKDMGGFPSTYQQGATWVLYRAEDQSPGCED
jgi:hypothetical protein